MPVPRYQLDDRNFDDLVNELVARIPAHTPEWTNPQIGDPGRTLIDLFAWLGDTILYRVNLLPERQRLEFLRLLNIPMRPALAASGLVILEIANKKIKKSVYVPPYTTVKGPVDFEITDEITVLPVFGRIYAKRRPTEEERKVFTPIKDELEDVYDIEKSEPYVTTPLFNDIQMDPNGFDFAKETIDQCVWIALLAADEDENLIEQVKKEFDPDEYGAKVINIGIQPRIAVPEFAENIHESINMKELWQWEMPSSRIEKNINPYYIPYLPLEIKEDATEGFVRQGIVQLVLPSSSRMSLPLNSVDENIYAGTGNHPPRIDDEKTAKRLVSWIRLRPKQQSESLALTWLGINAVKSDQRKTIKNVIVATSSGSPDQTFQLPATSIEVETFKLQVEETNQGFRSCQELPLHTASRDDRVFELDAEAGIIKFGDGLRGVIPEEGNRIRIQMMRYGGGRQGNIAAGNLTGILHPNLNLIQPIATTGGVDAETLEEAEKRIPGVLQHSHRAITAEDYRQIALYTPGVELGRIEVLPKFKPQQKLHDIVGVISVMVLPKATARRAPNPRPDRNMLSRVHSYLNERRPIGVELYVIGTEYVSLGLSVAISIRDGFAKNQVLQNVQSALRDFLWPLSPGGHIQKGWPLGGSVNNQELEVVVARVAGVRKVEGVNIFRFNEHQQWELLNTSFEYELQLEAWKLPELLTVVVVEDEEAPSVLEEEPGFISGAGAEGAEDTPGGTERNIPIPIVPEICR